MRRHCRLDEAGTALLKTAMARLGLSARAFSEIPEAERKGHRVLPRACGTKAGKLTRTIADLAGAEQIQPAHPSTALTPAASAGA